MKPYLLKGLPTLNTFENLIVILIDAESDIFVFIKALGMILTRGIYRSSARTSQLHYIQCWHTTTKQNS